MIYVDDSWWDDTRDEDLLEIAEKYVNDDYKKALEERFKIDKYEN